MWNWHTDLFTNVTEAPKSKLVLQYEMCNIPYESSSNGDLDW